MKSVIENFEKHGFSVSYFESANDAKNYLLDSIISQKVSIGGSMTCHALDLTNALKEQNQVFSVAEGNLCQTPDTYITSANALSKTGVIVNIDGRGNRVSASIYGPSKVIVICGTNKLCDDVSSAISRAKNIASPLNAKRLNRNTPCAVADEMKCYDCNSDDRICRATAILERKPTGISSYELILIEESLGY